MILPPRKRGTHEKDLHGLYAQKPAVQILYALRREPRQRRALRLPGGACRARHAAQAAPDGGRTIAIIPAHAGRHESEACHRAARKGENIVTTTLNVTIKGIDEALEKAERLREVLAEAKALASAIENTELEVDVEV